MILAADDLSPSETLQMDKSKILGFVTKQGSANSHTAILARTMGIPAICGLDAALLETSEGRMAYMDGKSGQLILDAEGDVLTNLQTRYQSQEKQKKLLQTMIGQEDITQDGSRIELCCNIGAPEDVVAVLENDGRGIGLFRSEFLYLSAEECPDEERQFQAYQDMVTAMQGRRVIIRTLDIGADKKVDYLQLPAEENPAMGLRAIRLCLERPEIFHTQLRALYRASAYGKVAIMFPMITSVWEVQACKDLCSRVMEELRREEIAFDPHTEIGIMIETPAAVLVADELATLVDFFSVGTNDLTQYILACDRQNGMLDRYCDTHHHAVLRALKMAADAAHHNGIWIGICGELAADVSMLPTFFSIGIDELSVTPTAVLPLRQAIRDLDMHKQQSHPMR